MLNNIKILFTLFLLLFLFSQCNNNQELVNTKDELFLYLDTLEQKYEEACIATGTAQWNLYTNESNSDLDAAKAKFSEIFLDTVNRNIIGNWRRMSGSLADELLARRLEMWWRCFIGGSIYADSQISVLENKLQKKIANYLFNYSNYPITLVEISNRIRMEQSPKIREKLWRVSSQLSRETKDDLIELVRLRNEKSNSHGYHNFYSLSLNLQMVREDWIVKTLNELELKTRDNFQNFIDLSKKKLKIKKFNAWDFDAALHRLSSISDNHFPKDSIFSILKRFHANIGFEVDSLPITEIIKNIPFGGLSIGINIPKDSRFILNPYGGKRFYNLTFHEYGHALQIVHTKVDYPILKGYEWIPGASCAAYSEGIADLQAEFVNDQDWLNTYTTATHDEIEKYVATRTYADLYYLRRTLKDFFFEYEMYKNPDQDLDSLEREMYKKYLLVELDDNTPHRFASSIWYVMYPCYFHNYILSKLIANQIFEVLVNKFGPKRISDPAVGKWIIANLYATGELDEWDLRIRKATGKSLETGAYLRKLKIMN